MGAFEQGRPDRDERLRAALSGASIGIWELDRAAGVIVLGAAAPLLLALPADEPVELQRLLERLHPEDRERVRAALSAPGNGAARGEYRDEFRTVAGSDGLAARYLCARALVAGDHLIGTLHDISDQKRAEEERDELTRRLARDRRAHELLARVLGHDLRGPVASMLTSTEVATRRTTEERLLQPLSRVLSTGHQLTRMIDQLLDFSTVAFLGGLALDLQPTDCASISRSLVEELRPAHPGRTIEVTATGDVRGVWDAARVGQALSVLLANAVQHGQQDAPVKVVIDGAAQDVVKLSVHNQGEIPADLVSRLFEAFRSDRKRAGAGALGLGLHVVRHIALAHGGDAEVTSSVEEGTTLTVTLPRAAVARSEPVPREELEEVMALERIGAAAPTASVTAQMYGVVPLHQRNPTAYWSLHERYGRLLMISLQRQMYKGGRDDLSDEVRSLADELGELRAGPREVAELHARALRQKISGMSSARAQSLVTEGRMMAFELMGHLLSFYRRRAG